MKTSPQMFVFLSVTFVFLLIILSEPKFHYSCITFQSLSSFTRAQPTGDSPKIRPFFQVLNSSGLTDSILTENFTGRVVCDEPKHNIVFSKMHKCSSSTVQNILMRYGDKHDLDFVLPPRGNYLTHGNFSEAAMIPFPVKKYNILCHHTRFSFQGMSELMPRNTVWTTIVRDPVHMFESTFYYFRLDRTFHLKGPDSLDKFAEDPSSYIAKFGRKGKGKNPMLFDLGLADNNKDDVQFIKEIIAKLDGYFDLVLVTEYFEESLILFKELMCWELDDIVYFAVNARANSSVHKINDKITVERLRKWNSGDQMLYDHFNSTLWKKIEAFGVERMKKEVLLLQARNEELKEKCIIDPSKTVNKGGIENPKGVNITGFVVKPGVEEDKLCKGMATAEMKFTSFLVKKQKAKYGMH